MQNTKIILHTDTFFYINEKILTNGENKIFIKNSNDLLLCELNGYAEKSDSVTQFLVFRLIRYVPSYKELKHKHHKTIKIK